MAVMNRFASVTESWKQAQSWVISKCCLLSEGNLFGQVSLLNTSFFLLPLANRAASRSAVSVPPQVLPALVLPSFLPCQSLKLPLSFGSMQSRCLQCFVPQNPLSAQSYHAAVARVQCLIVYCLKWETSVVFQMLKSTVSYSLGSPSHCWGANKPPHKMEAEGQII